MNLQRYTGHAVDLSDMPEAVQRAYPVHLRRVETFYGDTGDFQVTHRRVRLCEATADYLYSRHTPLRVKYARGTRPELEKTVARVLDGVRGERERMLAILRFVRDLYRLYPEANAQGTGDLLLGGLEETVIQKGSNMCNEQARAFCALCQVAGIPARYVGHHIMGHGVNEAFVDGAWAYVDIRGKYFEKSDGTLASAWDLVRDPSIIDRQSDAVKADVRPGYDWDGTRCYFSRVEITSIVNYFVWESAEYNYDWVWNTPERRARVEEVRREWPAEISAANILAMVRGEKPWPA